jgi:hypothetical protein
MFQLPSTMALTISSSVESSFEAWNFPRREFAQFNYNNGAMAGDKSSIQAGVSESLIETNPLRLLRTIVLIDCYSFFPSLSFLLGFKIS